MGSTRRGLVHAIRPRVAQKVPGGILHIVRVDRLVQFKLFAPIPRNVRVITRVAALPQIRGPAGGQTPSSLSKSAAGLVEMAQFKLPPRAEW